MIAVEATYAALNASDCYFLQQASLSALWELKLQAFFEQFQREQVFVSGDG